MGSEASRRKFRSANLSGSSASVDDGALESDGSIEHERKNINITANRSRRTADERGVATSGRAGTNTRTTRSGNTRQSGRESANRKK